MKKLLLILLTLPVLWGCRREPLADWALMNKELTSHLHYDVDRATELLCKKRWKEELVAQYSEGWKMLKWISSPEELNGRTSPVYLFYSDGTMEVWGIPDGIDKNSSENISAAWSFKPERQFLTITFSYDHRETGEEKTLISRYRLKALSEDSMILDSYHNPGEGCYRTLWRAE